MAQENPISTSETFKLKIICPERVIYKGEVCMAIIPGLFGDFGVLPRHAHFVSQLGQGQIKVYGIEKHADSSPLIFNIKGGFCEMGKKCVILIDSLLN